jgi:hypothetical protein
MVRFSLFNALYALRGEMIHDAIEKLNREVIWFSRNWNQLTARQWSGRFFEATTRLLSPGYWIYLSEFISDYWNLLNEIIKWNFKEEFYKVTWDEILDLVNAPGFNVSSIDWTNRRAVLDSSKLAKKVRAYCMLIKAKASDGSLGESNSLLLNPSIWDIVTKQDLQRIHKDLRPLVRFEKSNKRSEMVLRRPLTRKFPKGK